MGWSIGNIPFIRNLPRSAETDAEYLAKIESEIVRVEAIASVEDKDYLELLRSNARYYRAKLGLRG